MLSLIEVMCPHCGARGQVVVPPQGALLIGPCPHCAEMMLVFCGTALPLRKEIMESHNLSAKRDHLMGTLLEFLDERIDQVLAEMEQDAEATQIALPEQEVSAVAERAPEEPVDAAGISTSELDQFVRTALPLIDNRHYFHAIFG